MADRRGPVLPRLAVLLAVSCLGTGVALIGGRAILRRHPPLTPLTAASVQWRIWRWSPDPERRREAALLLHAEANREGDRQRARDVLKGHGWGTGPLAAVVLKREALAAQALERPELATPLWRQLWKRFPDTPLSADALYALGRTTPSLRQELLRRFPAHPAALAAAIEKTGPPAARLAGALHLARWGARWPGAHDRLVEMCGPGADGLTAQQRAQLADGLAELRDGPATLACLTTSGSPPVGLGEAPAPDLTLLSPRARFDLGRTLLAGDPARQRLGVELLLGLAAESSPPAAAGAGPAEGAEGTEMTQAQQNEEWAEEAVRLLSERRGAEATATLQRLPARWRESAPVWAHRVLARAGEGDGTTARQAAMKVFRRWPSDPASWDLQWELARERILGGRWGEAVDLLEAIDPRLVAPPQAARQRFWLGFSQRQLGKDEAATTTWRTLRLHAPGGYYGWRSAVALGEGDLSLEPTTAKPAQKNWRPLESGNAELDQLWRLDQATDAWESWRTATGGRPPRTNADRLLEGRLRQGVGDDWTGLGLLELATLRLQPQECDLLPELERSLHPLRFPEVFQAAAEPRGLPLALLLGVAKQESRFSPSVRSAAGAVGLMQVLPSTASELAGRPISDADLRDPTLNASLGAQYLQGLLRRWQNNPFLAVGSYNAGPGAVQGWISPTLKQAPEVWVEAIPYPETRLYVKKVLGNVWSYQVNPTAAGCR
jgi:soluble lytic murein transglycosylase